MKTTALLIAFLSFQLNAIAQEKPAYNIFTNEGRKVYYEEMLKGISDADIILFGEIHDDPVAHWLELEFTRSLAGMKGKSLVMGAEMFEADNQLIIDEYLEGQYALSKFEAEAKLWNNYSTDYRPLLEFAAEKSIPFVATNIPRRYASIVARKGFEGLENLSSEAKKYFPPLPIQYDPDLKGYKDMTEMGGMGTDSIMHENLNFPKAQAVKDATMAYFILRNWSPGKIFIHFNGAYHSRNYEGIVWYLKKSNPDLKVATIETLNQENIEKPAKSYVNRASFIILIPSSMTRTF